MSFSDYRRFSLNRELFPRQDHYSSNRLICGHLNRLKFPPNIPAYLLARAGKTPMRKAMAKANRCSCRREGAPLKEEEETGPERKQLIHKL